MSAHESILAALAAWQRGYREASGIVPGKSLWRPREIRSKVVLDETGTPVAVVLPEDPKTPWKDLLPAKAQRTGTKIAASLLSDYSKYSLGISDGAVDEVSRACHEAFCRLHREVFAGIPAAAPLLRFCESDPTDTLANPAISEHLKGLSQKSVGFLVRDPDGVLTDPADDPAVIAAANRALEEAVTELAVCSVTGAVGPVARLHPKVSWTKRQTACLVSANKDSMLHWASEKNKHLVMGVAQDVAEDAAEALEHLIADPRHSCDVPGSKKGASKLIWWADGADKELAEALSTACSLKDLTNLAWDMDKDDDPEKIERAWDLDARLTEALTRASRGTWTGPDVADPRIHVAVIAANVSRLTCETAVTGSASEVLGRIAEHQRALSIEWAENGARRQAPCLSFFGEVNDLRRFPKDPAPWRAGLMVRLVSAVLTGRPYPPELAQRAVALCGPKQRKKDGGHRSVVETPCARIVKADLIRNHGIKEESMTVDGNPAEQPQAVGLGRLLSVCEQVQMAVAPKARPLSGSYFTAASTVPATAFPNLIAQTKVRLAKLRKDNPGLAVFLERRLMELVIACGVAPTQFTSVEREEFCLGFYLEEQRRWTKKDTEEDPKGPGGVA